MREYSIGRRIVEGYLRQPYSWFLNRNSAELAKTILSEVNQIMGNGIRPIVDLIARGMIIIAIVTLLIIVDPIIAISVSFLLLSAYLIIFYIVKRYLSRIGSVRLKSNELRFLAISEALVLLKKLN